MSNHTESFWVFDNKNRYAKNIYVYSEALELSKTLVNCSDCINCVRCTNCNDCYNCHHCNDCTGVLRCRNCHSCYDLCGYINMLNQHGQPLDVTLAHIVKDII